MKVLLIILFKLHSELEEIWIKKKDSRHWKVSPPQKGAREGFLIVKREEVL